MYIIDHAKRLQAYKKPERVEGSLPLPQSTQNDSLIRTMFAPDPVTGLPVSDLVLVTQNGLSPELREAIMRFSMSPITKPKGFSSDADAHDSLIPRYAQDETYLLDYYERRGFDTSKISAVLDGRADMSSLIENSNDSNDAVDS